MFHEYLVTWRLASCVDFVITWYHSTCSFLLFCHNRLIWESVSLSIVFSPCSYSKSWKSLYVWAWRFKGIRLQSCFYTRSVYFRDSSFHDLWVVYILYEICSFPWLLLSRLVSRVYFIQLILFVLLLCLFPWFLYSRFLLLS